MHTAMPAMRAYMENGRFDAVIREIEHPGCLFMGDLGDPTVC